MYDPSAFKLYRTDPAQAICPNGERLRDATDRMLEAMQLIGSRHQNEVVAAVSHAVMIRLAAARSTASSERHGGRPWAAVRLTGFTVDVDGTIALVHAPSGGVPTPPRPRGRSGGWSGRHPP